MHGTYIRVNYTYSKQRVITSGRFECTADNIMKLVQKLNGHTDECRSKTLCFYRKEEKQYAGCRTALIDALTLTEQRL